MQAKMDFKCDMKTILATKTVKRKVVNNLEKHWPEYAHRQAGLTTAQWEHWVGKTGIWWSWLTTRPNSFKGIRDSISSGGAMYDPWIAHSHPHKRVSWCAFISYIQVYTGLASVDGKGMSSLAMLVAYSWRSMFTHPMHTRFYLQLEDADPMQLDGHALMAAVESKNSAVVALLLADERVVRSKQPWAVIRTAVELGTDRILEMLLSDSRDLPFSSITILDLAVTIGVPSTVRILLDGRSVNVSESALITACERNDNTPPVTGADHAACLQMLIDDVRLDVAIRNARIMRSAILYGQPELTKVLLRDPRPSLAMATSTLLNSDDYARDMLLAQHILDNYSLKLRDGVANLLTIFIECGKQEHAFRVARGAIAFT